MKTLALVGLVSLASIFALVSGGPFDAFDDSEIAWKSFKRADNAPVPNKDAPVPSKDAQASIKDASTDPNGRYVGDFNSECSESTTITKSKPKANVEPDEDYLKMPSNKCHWNVVGTEDCSPELNCKKFHLEPNTGTGKEDKCKEEYLEVTDGVGGYEKYCGDIGPVNVTATGKLRDLYITFKTNENVTNRKLMCWVTCSAMGVGKPLPVGFAGVVHESCHCGRKPNLDRIVGGEDAKQGEFPWIAGLVTAKTRRPFCGGTVINDRFILTAAHCFKGPYMKKENLQVLLGGHFMDLTLSKVASGQGGDEASNFIEAQKEDIKQHSVRFSVEKYFIHPLYVRQTNDFDVALIKLVEPIDFEKYPQVMPACMPDIASYDIKHEGKTAVVAGWGLNSSDASSTMATLQKLDVKVFKYNECKEFFEDRFTQRMMCAGYKEAGKDSCKGDSGSPLISEKKTQVWEIIGAVSWGESCAAKNSPGVYVRINEVSQWVRYMANNEDAQWCSE